MEDESSSGHGSEGEAGGFRERGRKERVLHTRITEQLADDIRRVADDLRMPVSNLVRNVLEETFSVVESVTDNLGTWLEDVANEVAEGRDRGPRPRRWARSWARARVLLPQLLARLCFAMFSIPFKPARDRISGLRWAMLRNSINSIAR